MSLDQATGRAGVLYLDRDGNYSGVIEGVVRCAILNQVLIVETDYVTNARADNDRSQLWIIDLKSTPPNVHYITSMQHLPDSLKHLEGEQINLSPATEVYNGLKGSYRLWIILIVVLAGAAVCFVVLTKRWKKC